MTTKPISASNASHSSVETARVTSPSSFASLTIAMISARREASTKRRRMASYSPALGSADCDDHHGMVSVSLGSADAAYLAVRVQPGKRRRNVAEGLDQRASLALERLAVHSERALASSAIEDDRRAHAGAAELAQRIRYAVPRRDDDAVGLLVGVLDGGVGGQVRRAHEAAVRRAAEHVAQADVAGQLGLGKRVCDRDRLELVVAERDVGEVELLQVDVLRAATVELEDNAAVRLRDYRRRRARLAAVSDAHADRAG